MKVAVIGSRCVDDYDLVKEELNKIKGITEIVSGGARGADTLAKLYADDHNIPIEVFLPDWSIGKMAGMLRNTQIVDYCDVAVVFWDGVRRCCCQQLNKDRGRPCHQSRLNESMPAIPLPTTLS